MKKDLIVIADDVRVNRLILVNALKDQYRTIEAEDGEQTLKIIAENIKEIAAVLLDIRMPKIDGFEIMKRLRDNNAIRFIPVILITEDKSYETMRKGYEYGAVEYVTKPFDIIVIQNCVNNIVNLYGEKNKFQMITLRQHQELTQQAERLKKLNTNLLDMLGTIVEFRELESSNHIKRVKEYTKTLAETVAKYFPEYNLDETEIESLSAASCMHDIGKILIPDSILLKPGKLTPDEYEIMKSHTTKGCEIIATLSEYQEEKYYKYSYEICRYHHERYDGKGYPEGLKEEEIPIGAQIVSLAEALDALMTNRVYKERIEFPKAYQMILDGECGMFSPKILHCFQVNKEKLEEIEKRETDKANY